MKILIPRQERVISYQDASNRPRVLIIVLLSLASFGRYISISIPPIQVAHENIRMRWDGGIHNLDLRAAAAGRVWGADLQLLPHVCVGGLEYHDI